MAACGGQSDLGTVRPSQKDDTDWYRPSQTRYGAHVASQRCTILRSGKALILCRFTQLMATPKTQIVLDMGYTLHPLKIEYILLSPLQVASREKKMNFQSGSRAVDIWAFPGFAPGCVCTPCTRVRFFICTRVHDPRTLFAPGCKMQISLNMPPTASPGNTRQR